MDGAHAVLDDGVVYLDGPVITDVREAPAGPPPGFQDAPVIDTGGTLFPGLIELHNHLPYNALRLWDVPRAFSNRNTWGGTPEYRQLITGPMKVLGSDAGLLGALVRYTECKALLGGTTTSQGVQLFSNAGARRFYRGLVRNVEATDDAELPEALTRVADVEATDADRFLARLNQGKRMLLHLSEGTDDAARAHFQALEIAPGTWAINENLVGIHCAALTAADFEVLGAHHGAMVWSPLSNLLLYGATARVAEAKAAGVRIALGSDWSPTGSKNVLGELKVAHLVSASGGGVFSDAELVAMATREAATILGWDAVLGSIEAGKRADLVVVDGRAGDPYQGLLHANEADIGLVMIDGVGRVGNARLMDELGGDGEHITVGGTSRVLNVDDPHGDPLVGPISLAEATTSLTDALGQLGKPRTASALRHGVSSTDEPQWFIALDELEPTGMELRPHLERAGVSTGPMLTAAAEPLALKPLVLDPLTVADDGEFLLTLAAERNLPQGLAAALGDLYHLQ